MSQAQETPSGSAGDTYTLDGYQAVFKSATDSVNLYTDLFLYFL